MNNIEEVKARIDIVDLVSETVELRRSGKNYMGFCPFHDNKRTPAFAVFSETGTWRCFGQCSEGGDIFKFVMEMEGWEFGESLRYLADKAGVQLQPLIPQREEQIEENERLRELLEDAVTFYRHQLQNTPAGKAALEYLHKRGLDDDTIETWGLGYAPRSWDASLNHFKSRGYTEADLVASGLITQRDDSGAIYDRFRHRAMFPIRDARGGITGFGARILDPDDVPKFLNSPQTALFDKGHLLYGLDGARKAIRAQDQAVIVEGYLDVIALHQHGFANAVSPMGTALTEHQLRLLKSRTRRIVLAMDADAAGNKATLRGLQLAREAMDREQEIAFDPRGLMHHEARLQADIRITTLPEGMDPDDVVNKEPEAWAKILEEAKPIVIHVMGTLAANRDLEDPKVKSEIAGQLLPLIEDIPSAIERETYRQKLARLLRVDERALIEERRLYSRVRRRGGRRTSSGTLTLPQKLLPVSGTASSHVLESHFLGVLLRYPSMIYRIDRALQNNGLNRLSSQDFQYTSHQVVIKLIQEALEQDFSEPLHALLGSLPLSMMDLTDNMLRRTENLEASENRILEELVRTILELRRRNVNQNVAQLRFLMEDAQQEGDLLISHYQQTMFQHTLTRQRLDKAMEQCNTHTILIG